MILIDSSFIRNSLSRNSVTILYVFDVEGLLESWVIREETLRDPYLCRLADPAGSKILKFRFEFGHSPAIRKRYLISRLKPFRTDTIIICTYVTLTYPY